MKKLLILILLYCCTNIYGQEKKDVPLLAEIDFLKEDPSMILTIGLIQNVQADWGKLGLRGKVMKLIEEEYTRDKNTKLSQITYDFNEKGNVTHISIDSSFHKYYWYSDKGQLEEEQSPSMPAQIYEYKKGKLKGAVYDGNIITSYGNNLFNLSYNAHGQIIKFDNLQKHISVDYDYNTQGRLIGKKYRKNIGAKPGNELYVNTLIEYNDKNDIERKFTKYVASNQTDTSFQVNIYKYLYDINDNWQEYALLGGGSATYTRRRIYYHDGTYSGDTLASEDSKRIYTLGEVDIPPQYPGGEEAMFRLITENIEYPEQSLKSNIQGRVIVSVIISDTGKLSDIEIVQNVSPDCDEEALRLVRMMPKVWTPAKKYGMNVNANFQIPIVFRLR